jgi:hypothetical protein
MNSTPESLCPDCPNLIGTDHEYHSYKVLCPDCPDLILEEIEMCKDRYTSLTHLVDTPH